MSSRPIRTRTHRILRHWTIDSPSVVGGSVRAAPSLPYAESVNVGQSERLARKLSGIKADLARRAG
ncbi:MAG TPA: hypothetical protein VIA29_11400 [Thermoanaerobaculia bacterium]